jgi:hypothetical protein
VTRSNITKSHQVRRSSLIMGMRAGKSAPYKGPRTSFDIDEILDIQPVGFRIVRLERDLRVAVAEEAGHLVQ